LAQTLSLLQLQLEQIVAQLLSPQLLPLRQGHGHASCHDLVTNLLSLCMVGPAALARDDNVGRSLVEGAVGQALPLLLPLVIRRTVPSWPDDSSLYARSLSGRAPEGRLVSCCGERFDQPQRWCAVNSAGGW